MGVHLSDGALMSLEFLKLLSQIPDPRRAQHKKWQLGPVLLSTILAILSAATCHRNVRRCIEARRERFSETFGFGWKAAPGNIAGFSLLLPSGRGPGPWRPKGWSRLDGPMPGT